MVTIPRPVMFALNWLPGQLLVLESMTDGALKIYPWHDTQMAQGQSPGVIVTRPPVVTR